jgi:hypothetical protein
MMLRAMREQQKPGHPHPKDQAAEKSAMAMKIFDSAMSIFRFYGRGR